MPYTTLPSVDELYKKNLEVYKPQQDAEIAEKNKIFDSRYQNTQNLYGKTIKDTEASYDEAQQKNELQKYINEKQLQENMANLGLTDSGLNRTQQTAVQLSYANNKADLNRQRQSAVDALTLEMKSKLTDIDTDRATAEADIKDKYTSLATSNAQSTYSANLDYIQKAQEAEEDRKNRVTFSYIDDPQIVYDENGEEITKYKFRGSDGSTIYEKKGTNVYTGDNNITGSSMAAKAGDEYGFFGNGYQPKGWCQKTNTGAIEYYGKMIDDGDAGYEKHNFEGKPVTIWRTELNGERYWFWSGIRNKYVQIRLNAEGKWEEV